MTRNQMLQKMYDLADDIISYYTKNYALSREKERKLWRMCSDWNSDHYENGEIFMCEYYTDNNSVEPSGFAIEDDVWLYPED